MPTKSTSKTMLKAAVVASARNARSPVWLILASLTPRGALSTRSIGRRSGRHQRDVRPGGGGCACAPRDPRPATHADPAPRLAQVGPSRSHSYRELPWVFLSECVKWDGGSSRLRRRDDPPSGGGDYWIAATEACTFDCRSVGSGAYPRSCSLPCCLGRGEVGQEVLDDRRLVSRQTLAASDLVRNEQRGIGAGLGVRQLQIKAPDRCRCPSPSPRRQPLRPSQPSARPGRCRCPAEPS